MNYRLISRKTCKGNWAKTPDSKWPWSGTKDEKVSKYQCFEGKIVDEDKKKTCIEIEP